MKIWAQMIEILNKSLCRIINPTDLLISPWESAWKLSIDALVMDELSFGLIQPISFAILAALEDL